MKFRSCFAEKPLLFIIFLLLKTLHFREVSADDGIFRKVTRAEKNQIIFAYVKQSLELECPAEVLTDTPTFYDWYKGHLQLYNEKGYTITKRGSLKIKSVSKKHAGIYSCEAIHGQGASGKFNITVIIINHEKQNENSTLPFRNSASRVQGVPPTIKKSLSLNVVHDLGGQATFHCVASAQPTPRIFWLKDGHMIEDAEHAFSDESVHSTLKIRGLKKSDAGTYKCIARNKVGIDEVDYILRVSEPSIPPKILSLEPSSISVKEGLTAVFWCKIKSKPGLKMHIKWLKRLNIREEGEPLDDVTLFKSGVTYYRPLNLSNGIGEKGVHQSKLIIRNVGKEDSGIYVCLALNDKGFSTMNGTLKVISQATCILVSNI